MVPAQMPELRVAQDVMYLKLKLMREMGDEEAAARFRRELASSLNTTSRQIDNMIHMMKHFN